MKTDNYHMIISDLIMLIMLYNVLKMLLLVLITIIRHYYEYSMSQRAFPKRFLVVSLLTV